MKKIINRKRYDTETAAKVGEYSNYLSPSDFNHVNEELYRKKTGEFFLYGEGGPLTTYAERVGDMWGGGESITPLTYEEAREWAEKKLAADTYEEVFGIADEGGGEKQTVSLRLSPASIKIVKREATQKGLSLSDYVDSLIQKEAK